MRIAIDAMGGDNAPKVIVQGAERAAKAFPEVTFELFGKESEIKKYLDQLPSNIEISHAEEIISGGDDPVRSIRSKKESSMVLAAKSVKTGRNDALFSAGNTGALLAAGTLIIGRIKNIQRPALMGMIPDMTGDGKPTVFLDLGANSDSKAEHINQHGVLGSYFAKAVNQIDTPRVALLNNGTEANKGSEVTAAAYKLLSENSYINFTGNIEAREIFNQAADVIVADGFTANAVLKAIEGTAKTIFNITKDSIKSGGMKSKFGALLFKDILSDLKDRLDYSKIGGAILVGVNALVLKTHGETNEEAVFYTLKQAKDVLESQVIEELKQVMQDENN